MKIIKPIYTTYIPSILAQTMAELLCTSTIKSITVRQIVDTCGLSVRTFYNYFKDKYDLMHYVYYTLSESCWYINDKPISVMKAYTEWMKVTMQYIDVWQNMYDYFGQNDIREFVLKKTTSDFLKPYFWSGQADSLREPKTQAALTMLSYGGSYCHEHTALTGAMPWPNLTTLLEFTPDGIRELMDYDPMRSPYISDIVIPVRGEFAWPPKLYTFESTCV